MSIYAKIGGAQSVAAAVDDFYVRVTGDPVLTGYFEDVDMARLKAHQRAFIASALGGPETYDGRGMGPAHAGLDISDDAFDRVVQHLVDTLTSLGVDGDTIAEIGATLVPLKGQIVTVSHPA
jgi:hemoglobin